MRFHAVAPLLVASTASALSGGVACVPAPRSAETAAAGTLHAQAVRLPENPTVTGARLVPIVVAGDASLGVEPGGGVRSITAGVRVVSFPGGSVEAAEDRLAGAKWSVTALPERLGGGFLFVVDERTVWRADRWLSPARPIYATTSVISRVVAGLDRVYVLASAWRAIDGTTGDPMPLGPWPASPSVGAYAAADGWRAVALADLRGAVATSDAGATWRPLRLPIEAKDVVARGDTLQLKGVEAGRGEVAFELRHDGQLIRVPEASRTPTSLVETVATEPAGPLGAHPLLAAVEDGWPLDDGTAVVARDGALARVRLDDGAIAEIAQGAYPLRPSRCHPIALGEGVGFVCGEPRGATVLYAFDAGRGRMDPVKRFDTPRAVLAAGNGALAVRGPCDARAAVDDSTGPAPGPDPLGADRSGRVASLARDAHPFCVRERGGAWREIRIEGAVGGERVAVLADGRFAVLSPPQGNLDAARLTIVEGERARSVAIVFPTVSEDVLHVLDLGVWLDGFEERRPGVLGGWIEAAGTMLGIEITLEGAATVGAFVKDAGLPMVSGRYGLGWTAQRVGYETTDGGMSWRTIDVPEPIAQHRSVTSRACGPVGCSAAGWLRIGWGKPRGAPPPKPPAPSPSLPRSYASLALDCAPTGAPVVRRPGGRSSATPAQLTPPATGKDERLVSFDVSDTTDRTARFRPLARIFAWGPKAGEWETTGIDPRSATSAIARGVRAAKWMVRWQWPFGGVSEAHASLPAIAPPVLVEAAKSAGAGITPVVTSLAIGDDASHALLLVRAAASSLRRAGSQETWVFALEADHPPTEIRRADGEAFGLIDGAIRAGGRWYFSTATQVSDRTEAVVWQLEGASARELARVPRLGVVSRAAGGRLVSRSDGRALGYVAEGQPASDRAGSTRWVASIDLDTGAVGEVTSLGSIDLGDRQSLPLCARSPSAGAARPTDEPAWVLDAPVSLPVALAPRGAPLKSLVSGFARLRLDATRACVERLAGVLDAPLDDGSTRAGPAETAAPETAASLDVAVAVGSGGERRVWRCGVR